MRYAETGLRFNLEIDLSQGSIERIETAPKLIEPHLGGLGTSVKIHWDRVPPETKPFDRENLLVFSNGLLCGAPAFSCNRTVVTTISPQSELSAHPMIGGFWAAELKYAGYDKVILCRKFSASALSFTGWAFQMTPAFQVIRKNKERQDNKNL